MQDFLAGELSWEDHERLKLFCVEEAEGLKERILSLRSLQREQLETLSENNPWLKTFGGLRLPDRLTRELACALIQRITIYTNDRIEVVFQYQNEREYLLAAIQEGVSA